MGGAPAVVTIRPGVQFVSSAADSFQRFENRLGRPVDVNSTYRDYDVQLGMYNAWMRYVNSGYNQAYKPNHSRALHPDYSKHCQGLALDSDDWLTPGFIDLAAEYGWVRTAANDPTEQHHFEYQWWNDQHRNEPVKPKEWDEMATQEQMEAAFRNVVKNEVAAEVAKAVENYSRLGAYKIVGIKGTEKNPGGPHMKLVTPDGETHLRPSEIALVRRHIQATPYVRETPWDPKSKYVTGEETFTESEWAIVRGVLARITPWAKLTK